MTKPLLILNTKSAIGRIAMAAAILTALVFVWFGVRWQLGNMLAELTSPNRDDALSVGNVAAGLTPKDPLPRWLIAAKQKQLFDPESTESALENFAETVRLAPHDFRWWIELGRAFEQAERPVEAEKALVQAVELAPSYTFPRWQLGNFYLRQNRTDEAFAELKKTTEKSAVYRNQVFSLAWDYFDKDPRMVEELAIDTPSTKPSLVLFYAARSSPKDALRIWNTLNDEQKAANVQTAKEAAFILLGKFFFIEAAEFARQSGRDPDVRPGSVTNGDFEGPLAVSEESLFGWKVNRAEGRADSSIDSTVRHGGARSLKTTFRNFEKATIYTLLQHVATEPLGSYRLSFWVRTENLKSGGPPLLEIANCTNDKVLAASKPYPVGSNDWEEMTVEFTVPENCSGVVLKTARVYCGEDCPLVGTFWYDDFNLVRQ